MHAPSILKSAYSISPVAVQDFIFSTFCAVQDRARYNENFQSAFYALLESESWSSDEIKDYQNRAISATVANAATNVPFYQKLFAEHGLNASQVRSADDLKKLPIISKSMVKSAGDLAYSSRCSKKNSIKILTSGTSGSPLAVRHSRSSLALQWAIWWRYRARFGWRRGAKFMTLGARVPVFGSNASQPFWRRDYFANRTYVSSYHLERKNLPYLLDLMEEENFEYITGYPSAIAQIAEFMNSSLMKLSRPIKCVSTGSDMLDSLARAHISRAFETKVTDQYGMAEFCGNLSSCTAGNYHVDVECCHLEVIDNRMVFTGFGNSFMPFIRYDIGDIVRGGIKTGCVCGRSSPFVSGFEGRSEDFLLLSDGRKIMGLNQVFEYGVGVSEVQVVQNELDVIEVNIVPSSNFDFHQTQLAFNREFISRFGSVKVDIRYIIVSSIQRHKNGKFKAVVNNLRNIKPSNSALGD